MTYGAILVTLHVTAALNLCKRPTFLSIIHLGVISKKSFSLSITPGILKASQFTAYLHTITCIKMCSSKEKKM